MKAKTITLYRMTAHATGEHLHVLLQDEQGQPPSVLGPLTPIEVDPGRLYVSRREFLSHVGNLMDRGWTMLGSHHSFG